MCNCQAKAKSKLPKKTCDTSHMNLFEKTTNENLCIAVEFNLTTLRKYRKKDPAKPLH